jgi:hypothetical protein
VDVYLPAGCHRLHADVAVTISVGVSAYMTMVMVAMIHCHFESKSWRTTAHWFACRKHGWDSELRDQHNQYQGKHEFLEHSVSL